MTDERSDGSAWPEWDLSCSVCGEACRPIDRFCSQCGHRDPTGRFAADALLSSPTIVGAADDPIDEYPQLSPTMLSSSGALPLDEDVELTDATVVLTPDEQRSKSAASSSRSGSRGKSGRVTTAERRRKQAEAAATLEKHLIPGNVFGRRYRIARFLGAGAMGYVCSAIDDSIDEVVALKILSAPVQDDPEAFERFKNELRLARRIRHRNVVQSFDLGFAEGYPYISMEYIDADNLLKHLHRKKRFEELEALTVLRQVLRGLRAAHDLGIIHRDIKPENILLNKDKVAFITDFGIATTADVVRRELAGTPDYMAPEQLRCEDVGPPSDLYACGVLLYRMLSGNLPFHATSIGGMIAAHLHEPPAPLPPELEVSPGTRQMIEWMLQKNMADRPQRANDLLERIDAALNRERTRSASQRLTVLLAEQDADTLRFVQNALETDGYKVLPTASAREAVNIAFEQTPSVILLDAAIRDGFELTIAEEQTTPGRIPLANGADGLGFCRIVRADEKLRRVPIVVMSHPSESGLKNEFANCGAADFLLKPLAANEITSAVQRVHTAALMARQV